MSMLWLPIYCTQQNTISDPLYPTLFYFLPTYLPTLEQAEIALQVEAMAMELMGAMEMDLGMNKPVCNAFFALQSQREPPATGWD